MFTLDPLRKPFQTFNPFNRVVPFKSFPNLQKSRQWESVEIFTFRELSKSMNL